MSKRLHWVRLEEAAAEEAEEAMAWRYLVARWVRVSRAERWVAMKPTDRQICDTAILATANENSDGVGEAVGGAAIVDFFFRDFDFDLGFMVVPMVFVFGGSRLLYLALVSSKLKENLTSNRVRAF